VYRLRTLGVNRFAHARADESLPDELTDNFALWLDAVMLVAIEGVTNALETRGVDPLNARNVPQFMNRVAKRLPGGRASPGVRKCAQRTLFQDGSVYRR
jgi:hypothetical protein